MLYIKVCVCFRFDEAMQALSSIAGRHTDDLFEAFVEMRGHLYLHAATLLLKLAQDRKQAWRAVTDLAALCYLLAYQVLAQQPANGLPRMRLAHYSSHEQNLKHSNLVMNAEFLEK